MREFDRIVTDYEKLNGIPHFKDTNITVSEIVKLVMDGKSNDDILAQYPALSTADIQEALAFALEDVMYRIASWRNEGLTPLISIKGYSDLIIKKAVLPSQTFEEMLPIYAEVMRKNAPKGIRIWNYLSAGVYSTYRDSNHTGYTVSVHNLIKSIERYLNDQDLSLNTEIDNQVADLQLRDHGYLEFALENLLLADDGYRLSNDGEKRLQITYRDMKFCHFQINRLYSDDYSQLDAAQFLAQHEWPIGTAALILHQHSSELKIHTHDDGVTFEFDLPVWEAPT